MLAVGAQHTMAAGDGGKGGRVGAAAAAGEAEVAERDPLVFVLLLLKMCSVNWR